MQKILVALSSILVLAFTALLQAGGVPEKIFESSFEFDEQCQIFGGLNDIIIVPTIALTGNFTLNGGNFPASEYDDGVFSLRDRVTGDVFELGNSHDGGYAVNIVPGRYDVVYSVETFTQLPALSPRNTEAVVMENVGLFASGPLDIDLTTHTISGDFLLNGAAFPVSEYDDGLIFLDSPDLGRLQLGETKIGTFSDVAVLAGSYEIRYQVQSSLTVSPWNEWGFVSLLDVSGNANGLVIDVTSIELTGSFTHNGQVMPVSEFDDGNFYLETDDGDRVLLGSSHSGGYTKNVIPGKYDAWWELESLGATVPSNPRARVGSNLNVASGTLNIDMLSATLSGDFSLNESPFPNTIQNTGRIVLRDIDSAVDTELELTASGSYEKNLVRGTYDIVYQHLQGDEVPQNKNAIIEEGLSVKIPATVNINVPARLFSASVYHNGALFPAAQSEIANILLRNTNTGDQALLGKTSQQNLSVLVVPGAYDVYYAYLNGVEIPTNSMARFQENLVISPVGPVIQGGGGTQLLVESTVVSGNMLLNDAPMPASEYDDGNLRLQQAEDTVLLGNTHDQSYQVRLLTQPEKTVYWIHYAVETLGDNIPGNGDARFMCVLFDPIIL